FSTDGACHMHHIVTLIGEGANLLVDKDLETAHVWQAVVGNDQDTHQAIPPATLRRTRQVTWNSLNNQESAGAGLAERASAGAAAQRCRAMDFTANRGSAKILAAR